MAVLEAKIASNPVKGLLDSRNTGYSCWSALILLVLAVVVVKTEADRGVVAGTSWPRSLDGVAAFRVTLQIESFGLRTASPALLPLITATDQSKFPLLGVPPNSMPRCGEPKTKGLFVVVPMGPMLASL